MKNLSFVFRLIWNNYSDTTNLIKKKIHNEYLIKSNQKTTKHLFNIELPKQKIEKQKNKTKTINNKDICEYHSDIYEALKLTESHQHKFLPNIVSHMQLLYFNSSNSS